MEDQELDSCSYQNKHCKIGFCCFYVKINCKLPELDFCSDQNKHCKIVLSCCYVKINCKLPVNVTSRSFPHSRFITGFVTRLTSLVPLVEQGLLTLPEHLSSPPVFSGVRVTRSLVLCVVRPFLLFLLAIVLSVLVRYTDSDYPFGIFKPFLAIVHLYLGII